MLEFRILGPVEVCAEGEPLDLGGRKPRALLALLVLDAGRAVSTDRIIEALWGERPPRTAATSLHNSVSQLRKLLGADTLVTKPPGYQLAITREQVDLERFRDLCESARTLPPEQKASKLREALALWRGSPLADLAFESFAQSEIGRLEALRLAILEERVEADLEAGRHTELIGELESLVAENAFSERLRGHLMLALYRSGRQAEALQVYHDARRVLIEELGIEPSPSLQQLHGAILRQDAALDLGGTVAVQQHPFEEIVATILDGRVIPVLGADVGEMTARLAERFGYPSNDAAALPRVAQYAAMLKGSGPLYDELHAYFDPDPPPSLVHRFLAALPPRFRERGVPHQLIVTTNYDLALEEAFLEAGEEIDVVSYVASGRNRGRFCHIAPDGQARLIDSPNTYATELSLDRRTIVLRLHGQVDRRPDREWESFVVMEDDYIDYLAQTDVANVVPVALVARLRRSHFLFLGYSMADWNLRLLLNRLWGDQPLSYRSWTVDHGATALEREFWRRRDVDMVDMTVDRCVEALSEHIGLELPTPIP
jgi:DNA-binding SARP family transcriptional activator